MPVRVVALVVLALIVGGCAPLDEEQGSSISVDVIQGRTDRDSRTIVLDVTNTGTEPIQLVEARLRTAQFADDAVWTRGTTLDPGRTVSLRAPLAEPVCPVPAAITPAVSVSYLDAAGATRTETVTPTQSTDVLALIQVDDCIAALTAEVADLRVSDSLAWTPGAKQPALLQLTATSTGKGSLEILEARSTILLQLVDTTGVRAMTVPLDLSVEADSGEQSITLQLVPARCDPHAIAEDKRGTIMVLAVRLQDGTEGVAYVRSPDEVKASLYAFVTDYCA